MRVLVTVALVLLAGCSTVDEPDRAAIDDSGRAPPAEDPDQATVRLRDCTEVAGISVYPRGEYAANSGPPEPFVPADIREDVGRAVVASANGAGWVAAPGEVAGHWHSTVRCASLEINGTDIGPMTWGWVGVRIEPPPFDASGIQRQYLLAVHSWPDPWHGLLAGWGHATRTEAAEATFSDGLASMLLEDSEHGRYEGTAAVDGVGDRASETIRFWILRPSAGHHNHGDQQGPYTPVALDLHDTAKGLAVTPETVGVFAHTQTDHHAPLPGLGGNSAMSAWTGFDRDITPGPWLGPILNETWVH